MSLPGFTAEHSIHSASRRFRSDPRRRGNGSRDSRVIMQKPNSENTPGGSCIGRISGTVITGTYDSQGRCCIYPKEGFPFCIDCDDVNSKCSDRKAAIRDTFTAGGFQSGVFTQAR
jgi:hypothetical protein